MSKNMYEQPGTIPRGKAGSKRTRTDLESSPMKGSPTTLPIINENQV